MPEARIGVDIVDIARIERIIERTPAFARRVFTDEERMYCEATPRPAAHYACRFAAREAVLKALGTGFSRGVGRRDVSVARDASGRPRAVLSGRAAEIADEQGIQEIALSLSFTAELAIANAMAITEEARPKPKDERKSEREVLAQSFKEARSILDDLERIQDLELESAGEGSAAHMEPALADEPLKGDD